MATNESPGTSISTAYPSIRDDIALGCRSSVLCEREKLLALLDSHAHPPFLDTVHATVMIAAWGFAATEPCVIAVIAATVRRVCHQRPWSDRQGLPDLICVLVEEQKFGHALSERGRIGLAVR